MDEEFQAKVLWASRGFEGQVDNQTKHVQNWYSQKIASNINLISVDEEFQAKVLWASETDFNKMLSQSQLYQIHIVIIDTYSEDMFSRFYFKEMLSKIGSTTITKNQTIMSSIGTAHDDPDHPDDNPKRQSHRNTKKLLLFTIDDSQYVRQLLQEYYNRHYYHSRSIGTKKSLRNPLRIPN